MGTEPMQKRDDIEEAAATWIARRDSDAWTGSDAAAFQAWLATSASHRVAWYRLNSAWTEAGRVRALGTVASGVTPAQPQEATGAEAVYTPSSAGHRSRRFAVFAVAASVLMLVAGSLVVFKDELFHAHRFTTVVGGLQAIPMSDGSRVTLDTNSEIRVSINDRERVIEIERGEAFFQVAHDARRPFIVKAGERRVTAVGTQFSVRREGGDFRVVVSEGVVRYEAHADMPHQAGAAPGDDFVLLRAGNIAHAVGETIQIEQLPVAEAERNLTWRSGFLTFRDTPLADAVGEFNRYNTRKIVIEDPAIAKLEVGGVFRSNNVDPFVRLLQRGFGIQAAVHEDRIVLTASPERRAQ